MVEYYSLPVEEEPEAQDIDDDHQQAIRLNQSKPSLRPVDDLHQPNVHHADRPQGREDIELTVLKIPPY